LDFFIKHINRKFKFNFQIFQSQFCSNLIGHFTLIMGCCIETEQNPDSDDSGAPVNRPENKKVVKQDDKNAQQQSHVVGEGGGDGGGGGE
jgi:ubiquitin